MNNVIQRRSKKELEPKVSKPATVASLRHHGQSVPGSMENSTCQGELGELARDTIPLPLAMDPQLQAMCHFYTNYVQHSIEYRPVNTDIVPRLYSQISRYPKAEYFTAAVAAFSLSALANEKHNPLLLRQSRHYFGRAVKLFSAILSDHKEAKSDYALLTTFMISSYVVSR